MHHLSMTTDPLHAAEDRLRRRAQQYLESHQLVAAQTTLESLLQRVPHDAVARMQLAGVLLERGQLRASTRELLAVVSRLPDDAALITQLVRRLYLCGETVAARHCLDHPALARDPSGELLAVQAHLHWMLNDIPAALALIERAMAAGVDTPDEHYLHAMLLQFTGQMERAGTVLDACLRRWPTFSGAAMARARLRRQTTESNHLDFLRTQLRRIPVNSKFPEDNLIRAEFEHALFKELDDLGQHDEAWAALERSNAIMHAFNPYDADGEAAVTDAIIRQPLAGHAGGARLAPRFEGPVPIFIVGMPRSGSTLLDRMLSNHSSVASAGEINDLLRQLQWLADVPDGDARHRLELIRRSRNIDFHELGARYLRQTQWRAQGRRYYINKLPTNFPFVDLIHRALPHAPILHTVREPMDVCFSNLKAMFGHTSAYSYDIASLAHYHDQYVRLMAHWHATLPDALLDVPYASLVQQPEAMMRTVLAHCGLELEEDCLHPERNTAPVATPSSAQVREAIHGRGLGDWQHYATQLEALRRALH